MKLYTYVTGSTKGLGRALKKEFKKVGADVVGLDRPDYRLNYKNPAELDKYVKNDFDIYINNAQYEFTQVELLYKLVEANKDRQCHIINIGSVSSDGDRKNINHYAIQKTALEKACTQLTLCDIKCKVSLIKPGRMNTDMVKDIDAPKLDPREVARAILWVAAQPKHINIKSITIDNMEIS